MGRESKERVGVCICIVASLCCAPETHIVSQLSSNKKQALVCGELDSLIENTGVVQHMQINQCDTLH